MAFTTGAELDLDLARPLLEYIDSRLKLRLPVDAMDRLAHDTPLDEEQSMDLIVPYGGKSVPLLYTVFKDDCDVVDIGFFTPDPSLGPAIGQQIDAFGDGD